MNGKISLEKRMWNEKRRERKLNKERNKRGQVEMSWRKGWWERKKGLIDATGSRKKDEHGGRRKAERRGRKIGGRENGEKI